jgi:hypothetical protein
MNKRNLNVRTVEKKDIWPEIVSQRQQLELNHELKLNLDLISNLAIIIEMIEANSKEMLI